jgi:hypothetical protein
MSLIVTDITGSRKGALRGLSRMMGNYLATRSRLFELFPQGVAGDHLFRQVNLPA